MENMSHHAIFPLDMRVHTKEQCLAKGEGGRMNHYEVARQVGEYDWELLRGPYSEIQPAIEAGLCSRKEFPDDSIKIIQLIEF